MATLIQIVDERGQSVGEVEKTAAHQKGGVWHRAISVFLFDSTGRLLIQKRAKGKYHFAELWANSCCSHPTVIESPAESALRAMRTELGLSAEVSEVGVVRYEAFDETTGLSEKEHDHIFVGQFTGEVNANCDEVEAVRWITLAEFQSELANTPEHFAPWLLAILHSGVLGHSLK